MWFLVRLLPILPFLTAGCVSKTKPTAPLWDELCPAGTTRHVLLESAVGAHPQELTYCQLEVSGETVRHGPALLRAADGRLLERRAYMLGEASGVWESFHADGRTQVIAQYEAGVLHGAYEQYFGNGRLREFGGHEHGRRTGIWSEWYRNGEIRRRGTYQRGVREDMWTMWSSSGEVLQEEMWVSGALMQIDPKGFSCPAGAHIVGRPPPDGQMIGCETVQGTEHGPFMSWYDNGMPEARGNYNAGRHEGQFAMWFVNGLPKTHGHHRSGKRQGEWHSWHVSGEPAIIAYFVNGKEEGAWRSFWDEGTLSAEGQFRQGLEHGPWRFYDLAGKISDEGAYENGIRVGWWTRYFDDGTRVHVEFDEAGHEIALRAPDYDAVPNVSLAHDGGDSLLPF